MIYTLIPEKDTYITNRVIGFFNCNNSNVGQAATLDIFKINNENNRVKSWAILNVQSNLPLNNETFTLTDSKENQVTFKFISGEDNTIFGETVSGEDNIKIGLGLTPYTQSVLSSHIASIINSVSEYTQTGPSGNLTLDITGYYSNKTILLEQNTFGIKGDKKIIQSSSSNLLVKKDFSRLEYSNLLIKFELDKFKKENIANFQESIFSDKSKYKAELELVDLSLGHAKPRDYSLSLYPLSKSFDEGLGKDSILFEDLDSCNFITSSFDSSTGTYNTWGINNFLVEDVDIYQKNNNISLTSSFYVEKGDENIKFDVTNYLHQFLREDIGNEGFSIRLGDSHLFNDSSYFVKRLGSKHLLNKKFIPKLNIKINDQEYYLPKNNLKLKKYYNTSHDFYLYNSQSGRLKNISRPSGYDNNHLSASLQYNDFTLIKKGLGSDKDIKSYTNISGLDLEGIYKFNIGDDEVSRFDEFLSSSIETSQSGSIDFNLQWYWFKEGETPEKRVIKSEKVRFDLPDTNDFTIQNIIPKITINNFNLIANNTEQKITIFFVDTKKQYESNKKPYNLECANIGDVYMRIIDTFDNTVLLEHDTELDSTKLFFNGVDYEINLHVSSHFKNKIIQFEFITINEITKTDKVIKDFTNIKVI